MLVIYVGDGTRIVSVACREKGLFYNLLRLYELVHNPPRALHLFSNPEKGNSFSYTNAASEETREKNVTFELQSKLAGETSSRRLTFALSFLYCSCFLKRFNIILWENIIIYSIMYFNLLEFRNIIMLHGTLY